MNYKEAVKFLEALGGATFAKSLPVRIQYELFQVATFMWGHADKLEKVLEAQGGQTLPAEYKLAQEIRELKEEIERLKGEAGVEVEDKGPCLIIPFVFSRAILIRVVDELMFRLKGSDLEDQMLSDFRTQLKTFIERWNLDTDQHSFASMREEDDVS